MSVTGYTTNQATNRAVICILGAVRTLMKETFAGRRHWVLTDPSPVTELSYKKNFLP